MVAKTGLVAVERSPSTIKPEVPMVHIHTLWLPILLSSVIVFVVSALIHMVLGYHANDFHKLQDEDDVAEALRRFKIVPGEYMLPKAGSPKEMKTPEFQEKWKKGPRAILNIFPDGTVSMTSSLVLWFLYCILIGIFAAYISGRALGPGVGYLSVFRFVGFTAFACYVVGGWQASIWFRRSWVTTLKNTIDGLVYALLTAGTFGWLWPK